MLIFIALSPFVFRSFLVALGALILGIRLILVEVIDELLGHDFSALVG
jgi:hypothetical protein